jgi:hypothetical protein
MPWKAVKRHAKSAGYFKSAQSKPIGGYRRVIPEPYANALLGLFLISTSPVNSLFASNIEGSNTLSGCFQNIESGSQSINLRPMHGCGSIFINTG